MTSKKILFIAPEFYDYHVSIKDELQKKYEKVFFRNEIPFSATFSSLLRNSSASLYRQLISIYNKRLLKLIRKERIDNIFVIRGSVLSESFLIEVKNLVPKIKIFHYQWDSIKNNPNALIISKYSDYNYSFDLKDCEHGVFTHIPLFYLWRKSYLKKLNTKRDIDLLFIGAYMPIREKLLYEVGDKLEQEGFSFKKYLFIKRLAFIKLKRKLNINRKNVTFKQLTRQEYYNLLCRTKIVLDIPSPHQTGATMRTIEVLSLGVKLISTNSTLREESFFHNDNIEIWNPDKTINLEKLLVKDFNHSKDIHLLSLPDWLIKIGL